MMALHKKGWVEGLKANLEKDGLLGSIPYQTKRVPGGFEDGMLIIVGTMAYPLLGSSHHIDKAARSPWTYRVEKATLKLAYIVSQFKHNFPRG